MTTSADLAARVAAALSAVGNPRQGGDVLSSGMVRDLAVADDGTVTFTFVLTSEDPAGLARQARKAVAGVGGVAAVKVNVVDAGGPGPAGAAPPARSPAASAPPPPPTPVE
ncbi:MAG: iron-sulfur cluster assembly protein, partial [Gemmatimonadales bacterium]